MDKTAVETENKDNLNDQKTSKTVNQIMKCLKVR